MTEDRNKHGDRIKGDPRDDDFVVKYEKTNFQKSDGEGGLPEMY